jgi:hypothetical protein
MCDRTKKWIGLRLSMVGTSTPMAAPTTWFSVVGTQNGLIWNEMSTVTETPLNLKRVKKLSTMIITWLSAFINGLLADLGGCRLLV